MSICDIRHQPRAHRVIQRALAQDRVPHAYVFHGPDGVGKESFARALAAILLCPNPQPASPENLPELRDGTGPIRDACGRCEDCLWLRTDTHPDLHLVYRQLNRFHPDPVVQQRKALDLGVDVVRHFVIDAVGAKPLRGRAKVFIIRQADDITPSAQSALLKTLEEPPPTTFLILLVSSLDRLLATTRSRCHLAPFDPLPSDFIAERLRRLRPDLPVEDAQWYARLAQGSLGAAVEYADDHLSEYNEPAVGLVQDLKGGAATARAHQLLEYAKSLGRQCAGRDPDISDTEAQRRAVSTLLTLMATWYRDLIHTSCQTHELLANIASRAVLTHRASVSVPTRAAEAIEAISRAERQLDLNVNVQLCLEALFVRLARLS